MPIAYTNRGEVWPTSLKAHIEIYDVNRRHSRPWREGAFYL